MYNLSKAFETKIYLYNIINIMEPSEYIFRLGKIKSKYLSLEILYYAHPSYS
jgi:hypothetical protein